MCCDECVCVCVCVSVMVCCLGRRGRHTSVCFCAWRISCSTPSCTEEEPCSRLFPCFCFPLKSPPKSQRRAATAAFDDESRPLIPISTRDLVCKRKRRRKRKCWRLCTTPPAWLHKRMPCSIPGLQIPFVTELKPVQLHC